MMKSIYNGNMQHIGQHPPPSIEFRTKSLIHTPLETLTFRTKFLVLTPLVNFKLRLFKASISFKVKFNTLSTSRIIFCCGYQRLDQAEKLLFWSSQSKSSLYYWFIWTFGFLTQKTRRENTFFCLLGAETGQCIIIGKYQSYCDISSRGTCPGLLPSS